MQQHRISSAVATSEEMQHAFDSTGLKCGNDPIPTPTPLCKNHYHLVYNALQSRQKCCVTCGSQLKLTNHRPCPKPDIIQLHLQERTGFEGEIHSQDRVFLTCYKSHLVILKENQPISTDSALKQLIDTYWRFRRPLNRHCIIHTGNQSTSARPCIHLQCQGDRHKNLVTCETDFI